VSIEPTINTVAQGYGIADDLATDEVFLWCFGKAKRNIRFAAFPVERLAMK
jgi:hypothetical protein